MKSFKINQKGEDTKKFKKKNDNGGKSWKF